MNVPCSPADPMHFGHVFLTRLYGLVWRLARPVLRRNKRLADGFDRRLVPDTWATPCDVWLQAASGGEAYLVWETLNALPAQPENAPPVRVLATTWTRQGLEVLQGMAATFKSTRPDLQIQVTLFPFDHPSLMYRALKMVTPKAVVLLETELWPGLLFACKRCHIPVLVLNGRLSSRSARNYRLMNMLAPGFWDVAGPAAVSAMSEADADRFRTLLPAERVSVAPNIKFDRAVSASPTLNPALIPLFAPGVPVLLLASVREQEERHLFPLVKSLLVAQPEAIIVVAPRHLHRVDPWLDALSGRPVRLRTGLTPVLPARAGQIVIWNRFGELSALYALATSVFLGGSLAPLGGQNFLEALAAGRIPHTGPHLRNFAWALDGDTPEQSLAAQNLIHILPDAEALFPVLKASLAAPESPAIVRQRFLDWLESRKGGAAKSAALLQAVLFPTAPAPVQE